jgi:hypothetical protein
MATVTSGGSGQPVSLSAAQVGNGVSTNIGARRTDAVEARPALLRLITAIGATPTCTYVFEISPDGTFWFPMLYQDISTNAVLPAITSVAIGPITTAITKLFLLPVDIPWGFVRATYSANTNVTNTLDLWAF